MLGRGNRFFLNFSKNRYFVIQINYLIFPKKHIHKIELIKPLVFKAFYGLENENLDNKFCFLIFGGVKVLKFLMK